MGQINDHTDETFTCCIVDWGIFGYKIWASCFYSRARSRWYLDDRATYQPESPYRGWRRRRNIAKVHGQTQAEPKSIATIDRVKYASIDKGSWGLVLIDFSGFIFICFAGKVSVFGKCSSHVVTVSHLPTYTWLLNFVSHGLICITRKENLTLNDIPKYKVPSWGWSNFSESGKGFVLVKVWKIESEVFVVFDSISTSESSDRISIGASRRNQIK